MIDAGPFGKSDVLKDPLYEENSNPKKLQLSSLMVENIIYQLFINIIKKQKHTKILYLLLSLFIITHSKT